MVLMPHISTGRVGRVSLEEALYIGLILSLQYPLLQLNQARFNYLNTSLSLFDLLLQIQQLLLALIDFALCNM